ncbi:MAG TPA: MBL fold metallo-hydrolase [Candidatus Limnocylindrales bacterium]|jgi:ribonuclease BN (tRNA processing enzyme)
MTGPTLSLQLVVVGAGPAYTTKAGSSGASYLVRSDRATVLLDLGQGSFPRLAAVTEPSSLDAVVVSHLHPDHFIDLVPLRHYLAYQFRPARRVRVIAPVGLADRLDALHAQPGFTATSLEVEPFRPEPVNLGDLELVAWRVTHTEDSHAIRVAPAAGGPGLVYSGDCGRAADLAPFLAPGDTLLVEVSFGTGPVPPGATHLDAPAIAELVASTSPGRVLLTHLQMGFDGDAAVGLVQAATRAPVRLVEPGDVIDLSGT